jgi:chloramphenicol-sensitive protein RarD
VTTDQRASTAVGVEGANEERRGAIQGLFAYLCWGLFPLYFNALAPATPWEILAHRILWSLLFCVVVLVVLRDASWVRPMLRRRRFLAGLTAAAVFLAVNWLIYVSAVTSGNVTEAALGYFLNPIVTVALGVAVLGERLRPMQWAAVAVGLVAALYLSVGNGRVPWVALGLAVSFALYGLIKKRLGPSLPALHGFTVETVVLTLPACAGLVWLAASGQQTFTSNTPWHPVLLALSGVLTTIPMLLFAAAARRVPLVTIGMLQFVTPVMQLLCGVLLLGETMSAQRWIGFGIVWVALAILSVDSVLAARRRGREVARTDEEVCEPAP